MQIDPRERFLIDAFKGGYRKKKIANKELYLDEPEKNEYSHLMNALEYLVSRLQYGRPMVRKQRIDDNVAMTYSA